MLSTPEAARYLGVSANFLKARRGTGAAEAQPAGPEYYKLGKKVVYAAADLDAWLAQHRRGKQ